MGCPRPNTPRSNPKDLGELVKPLRDRLWTMFQDAPNKGLTIVSGYRDPGRQWDLRHDRCPGRECDHSCKGHPTTALPGQSNHGRRKACDVGGRDLRWFVANVHRYGLGLPVPGENWHAEVSGTPSVRILTYPGPAYDQAAPPAPAIAWAPFHQGDTDKSVAARHGEPFQVTEAQLELAALAKKWGDARLDPGKPDGAWGRASVAAWVAFQRRIVTMQAAQAKKDPTVKVWTGIDGNVTRTKIDVLRWWSKS